MSSKRLAIKPEVKRQVLMEAGYRCAVPTCRNILAIDLHHIVQVSENGGNDPGNLIALCGVCHDLYHRGEITKDAISNWKGMLISLNFAFDRDSIDNLLFLRSLNEGQLIISGDGVLKFSRLIASGLAQFKSVGLIVDTHRTYEVELSTKGIMLVDAWIKGDRGAVENALAVR